jgi:polyhydroxyalkanoate synthesis regulator phasin
LEISDDLCKQLKNNTPLNSLKISRFMINVVESTDIATQAKAQTWPTCVLLL